MKYAGVILRALMEHRKLQRSVLPSRIHGEGLGLAFEQRVNRERGFVATAPWAARRITGLPRLEAPSSLFSRSSGSTNQVASPSF